MTSRLFLGDCDHPWLLADSEDPEVLSGRLAAAAKTGEVVPVVARRTSRDPETTLFVNPSRIPFWFMDEAQPQRVGRIY